MVARKHRRPSAPHGMTGRSPAPSSGARWTRWLRPSTAWPNARWQMGSAATKSAARRVRFGDVVRLCTDRCANLAAEGIDRYVGLEHLEPSDLRIRKWGLVAEGTTFT